MEPAYLLLLNEKQFAQLGELTAIIGQVDEILIRTVAHLLNVERVAANRIMGSTKVADNASIWSELIRAKTTDENILWLVTHAMAEIQAVSTSRNDFVHAWFQRKYRGGAWGGAWGVAWGMSWGGRPTVEARRVKSDKPRPVSDLPIIRDQAARLSCLVAHIDHLLKNAGATESPWLERFESTLPPRPTPDETPRPGRPKQGPPKS